MQGATADPRAARRTQLSRDEVADVALALVDRDGLEGLSMRRLAEHLGVGTMTLYGYFRNKRELLDAVVDAAVRDEPRMELSGDWREQLGALIRSARSLLLRHPSLVQLRTEEPVFRPEALRFPELGVRILQGAGFSASEATMGFRLLFTFSFGYAAFTPVEVLEEDRAAARAALRALPPDQFPALTGVAEEAARAMGGEETFEYGLERLLDGLEARLAALS